MGVLKSFANFKGKHLCWSLFLIKLQPFCPSDVFFLWVFLDRVFYRTPMVYPRFNPADTHSSSEESHKEKLHTFIGICCFFTKRFILDVLQGAEYASGWHIETWKIEQMSVIVKTKCFYSFINSSKSKQG